MDFFGSFNFVEFLSAFIVLFAIIDPIGIMPVVLSLRGKGKIINIKKAVFYSFVLMFVFFFVGDWILGLFGVDINSFAVAGGVIIFLMSLEMILDIEIFKDFFFILTNPCSENIHPSLINLFIPILYTEKERIIIGYNHAFTSKFS